MGKNIKDSHNMVTVYDISKYYISRHFVDVLLLLYAKSKTIT